MKKISMLMVAILCVSIPAYAKDSVKFSAKEASQFFEAMVSNSKESCLKSFEVSDSEEMKKKITAYCACASDKLNDIFTKSDAEKMATMGRDGKHAEMAQFVTEKAKPSAMECRTANGL